MLHNQHYQPTLESDDRRNCALFWWAEELTEAQRAAILRDFLPLMSRCKGLAEAGVAELAFALVTLFEDAG